MTDRTITLAGKEYVIPLLVIKQNRHVEPLAARHGDYFTTIGKSKNLLDLTDEQAEDFTKIVYHTLTRALPTLTFAEFEQMPISMRDVMMALPVCLQQSGLFKPVTEAPPTTGEEQPSTGTA